jgi:hypothetical protein
MHQAKYQRYSGSALGQKRRKNFRREKWHTSELKVALNVVATPSSQSNGPAINEW